MTTQALTRNSSLDETMKLGEILAKSGYFEDAKEAAQAVVKILAGRELGIEPIAAMSGISIVKNRPSFGANLMAALIRRHEAYDYQINTLDDEECRVTFFYKGKPTGTSSFSMADAARAGLKGKDIWKHYPRNMLFARTISNGAKWFCPDIFAGQTVYTPDEMGEGGPEILDVEAFEVSLPPPLTPNTEGNILTKALPSPPGNQEPPEKDNDAALRRKLEALITEAGINRENFKRYLGEKCNWLPLCADGFHLKDLSSFNLSSTLDNWDKCQKGFLAWVKENVSPGEEETALDVAIESGERYEPSPDEYAHETQLNGESDHDKQVDPPLDHSQAHHPDMDKTPF